MKKIEQYLQTLKGVWLREPNREQRNRFYLTPEQRVQILTELLCPFSRVN